MILTLFEALSNIKAFDIKNKGKLMKLALINSSLVLLIDRLLI